MLIKGAFRMINLKPITWVPFNKRYAKYYQKQQKQGIML